MYALITGAGGGLGLELVREHLRKDWNVFALPHHRSEGLEKLKEDHPDQLIILPCDVRSSGSVKYAMEAVRTHTGRLDRIFNNAGIDRKTEWTTLDHTDVEFALEVYNTNALGPLRVVKSAGDLIGPGTCIVNISSEAGGIEEMTLDCGYGYCMSKVALNMQSKILYNWLKEKGVHVLAIHPGRMRTGMEGPDSEIDPWETSGKLMELLENVDKLPEGQIFFKYTGEHMKW